MPEVMISGPEGRLEARYHHSRLPNAPIALLLHPHPLFGGTMNNKVVYSTFRLFRGKHYSTMRLNFRGVGRSQGSFDRGEGELSDAASCLDWLQSYNPNATSCWIVGVSFGAWIGMQLLMRRPEISRFISIAPPADKFDFTFLAPCPTSGLVLRGAQDETVAEESVTQLVQRLSKQKDIVIDYRTIGGANHLFQDRLDELSRHIEAYLDAYPRADGG